VPVPSSSHVSLSFLGYEQGDVDVPEAIGARFVPAWLDDFRP